MTVLFLFCETCHMPAIEGIFIIINSGSNRSYTSTDFRLIKNDSPFTHCSSPWTPVGDIYTQNKDLVTRLELGDTLHASTSTGVFSDLYLYPAIGVLSLSEAMYPLEDLVVFSVMQWDSFWALKSYAIWYGTCQWRTILWHFQSYICCSF